MITPGDNLPYFELGGVDDEIHTPEEWADRKLLVVIFTCNHCPYAQAYEERLIALQKRYSVQSVQFVAINSNDSEGYPEDGFREMKKRAKESGFNYPYLRDKSQAVARKFGAACTPEAYLFDRHRICKYRGRIDDSWRDPSRVKEESLKEAISDLLAGKEPVITERPALGCSIKWK